MQPSSLTDIDDSSAADFIEGARLLEAAVQTVIIGQQEVVRETIIALVAGGHVLLEGVPGLGKTLLVRTLGAALDLSFSRIQFTPDLMPADITGTTILREDEGGRRSFAFQRGPLFAHLVLADEVNRATPKTQSALLEAMQEHTVTVGTETHVLPAPFFVLATQNPLEMEGTYPLPEAQLDRFLLKILVPFPDVSVLRGIIGRTIGPPHLVDPVLDSDQMLDMMRSVRSIYVADAAVDLAVAVVTSTHPESTESQIVRQYVRAGASPRGLQAIVMGAQAAALLDGRHEVSLEDVRRIATPALRHRILLNFEGEAEAMSTDAVVADILRLVPPS